MTSPPSNAQSSKSNQAIDLDGDVINQPRSRLRLRRARVLAIALSIGSICGLAWLLDVSMFYHENKSILSIQADCPATIEPIVVIDEEHRRVTVGLRGSDGFSLDRVFPHHRFEERYRGHVSKPERTRELEKNAKLIMNGQGDDIDSCVLIVISEMLRDGEIDFLQIEKAQQGSELREIRWIPMSAVQELGNGAASLSEATNGMRVIAFDNREQSLDFSNYGITFDASPAFFHKGLGNGRFKQSVKVRRTFLYNQMSKGSASIDGHDQFELIFSAVSQRYIRRNGNSPLPVDRDGSRHLLAYDVEHVLDISTSIDNWLAIKDVLLIVFSTFFGVGISAFFEAYLAGGHKVGRIRE